MIAEWQTIILALIVSVIAPLIMAVVVSINRRADKAQDWKRLDDVRDQAAEAARLLVEANKVTTGKLDDIHKLVNSNMTEQMQGRLDSTIRERAALIALNALHSSTETKTAIKLAESSIAELTAMLEDRRK